MYKRQVDGYTVGFVSGRPFSVCIVGTLLSIRMVSFGLFLRVAGIVRPGTLWAISKYPTLVLQIKEAIGIGYTSSDKGATENWKLTPQFVPASFLRMAARHLILLRVLFICVVKHTDLLKVTPRK